MPLDPQITILSTLAVDKILNVNKETIKTQEGGPLFYFKKVFDKANTPVLIKNGEEIEVDILINKKGEFGRIKKQPIVKKIDYSKIRTPYLLISTILDEWSLEGISNYKGKVFLDVQGYVRDGNDFGQKKIWNPSEEIIDNIFCLKGTKQEILNLPKSFVEKQKNKILIITRGEKGIDLWFKNIKTEIKPRKILKTKDTIGAGDTLFANFLFFYSKSEDTIKSAEFAAEAASIFLSRKECKKISNSVLFLSSTHGDEGFSIKILQKLEEKYPQIFSWMIANEKALEKGVRFIATDLNRVAPGDKNSVQYECRRAHEIIEIAKKYSYTIDIHGTTANSGIFTIVTNPKPKNLFLANALPPQNVVIWTNQDSSKNGSITQFVNCGVEIECGPKNSEKIQKKLFSILKSIVKNGVVLDTKLKKIKNYFKIYGKLVKSDYPINSSQQLKDFKKVKINNEEFYPILVGQYPNTVCYKAKKVNKILTFLK